MPKVSCAPKDAVAVSLGIQEGVVEIVKAVVKVHQYPPNKTTHEQGDPFPCVQLTVIRCNAQTGERENTDEITEEFGIGKLDKFHPGKADSATDEEPEDLGEEVDTEGNCIFAADETAKLAKTCKWIKLADSLEKKGFKAEVLGNGFMPDLVGLKAEVKTVTGTKFAGSTAKNDPTWLEVTRVLQFPYDKKAKTSKATPAGKATPASKTPAPATAPASDDDDQTLALSILTGILTESAGKTIERKKLQTAVQMAMMRSKPPIPAKRHKPVLDLVKSDEWLTGVTGEDGVFYGQIVVDFEAQTVMFAAAE